MKLRRGTDFIVLYSSTAFAAYPLERETDAYKRYKRSQSYGSRSRCERGSMVFFFFLLFIFLFSTHDPRPECGSDRDRNARVNRGSVCAPIAEYTATAAARNNVNYRKVD